MTSEVETQELPETEEINLSDAPGKSLFANAENKNIALEAMIFASGEPLPLRRMLELLGASEDELREILNSITEKYDNLDLGFELVCVGGKYQFRTKGEFAPFVRLLKTERPRRLSAPALETLSVIAYRQPVTRYEIEKIRGVDATPTIKTLLDRGLIKILGHKDAAGQPALYGTSEAFLEIFSMGSLEELPSLRDITELEREPGEVEGEDQVEAESEATFEEAAGDQTISA